MDQVGLFPARSPSKRTHRFVKSPSSPSSPKPDSTRNRSGSTPLSPVSPKSTHLAVEDDKDVHGQRDSLKSIRDDPFFRNYQSPHSVSLARELRSATYMERLNNGNGTVDPSSKSVKKNVVENSVNIPPRSRSGVADINIAVIGSAGVGKSTLIQRALGLRLLPSSVASSLRMPVENVFYTVSLIELDLESFDIIPDRRIQWPKQINGHIVLRIDGALLLYDVMNRESIADLPQTMTALVNSLLPTILVSCKCDNPENSRQIDVNSMESACMTGVEFVKTAANVPESARTCLNTMLKSVMNNRNAVKGDTSTNTKGRARATSSASANIEKSQEPGAGKPLSQTSKHSRASSEYTFLRPASQISAHGQPPSSRPNGRTNLQYQFKIPDPHEAPPLSSHLAVRHESGGDSSANSRALGGLNAPPSPSSPGAGRAADKSFLDMEESDADSFYRYSDDIPILQRNDDSFFDKPAKVAGVTFDELVDRLLAQPMTRADSNFSDIFLCLYRKFAAPGELFGAILVRLGRIAEDRNMHYLTRTTIQLRIITVVAKWVSSYPGDFASPMTSQNLDSFINHLASDPVFAAAAQDMRAQLQSRVIVDDDTGWARTDADVDNETNLLTGSVPPSPAERRGNFKIELEGDMSNLTMDSGSSDIERKASRSESNFSGRASSPAQSLSLAYNTVEDYEREAATMIPKSTLSLTKVRYHLFMDTPDDGFAHEMTRIDWVMFSSIRLRDFVRHVSLSLDQKEKCRGLANVNRMINHFNHIAKWVANMILIRDKAKHRALMLEKFMTIALKLRIMNNYNGLAAVLAGINGSAIHRLAQTRALVPADAQKRFARLVLLMITQKSHFAYRLAWENSPLPRIPFIPLHRRDLVSAEEGSRTFVGANGERINWKKFEVLSEVILPIMKSQVVPYPHLIKHETARELIMDFDMPTDDEDIYQRSVQVESSSGVADPGKKKFPWFLRGE